MTKQKKSYFTTDQIDAKLEEWVLSTDKELLLKVKIGLSTEALVWNIRFDSVIKNG